MQPPISTPRAGARNMLQSFAKPGMLEEDCLLQLTHKLGIRAVCKFQGQPICKSLLATRHPLLKNCWGHGRAAKHLVFRAHPLYFSNTPPSLGVRRAVEDRLTQRPCFKPASRIAVHVCRTIERLLPVGPHGSPGELMFLLAALVLRQAHKINEHPTTNSPDFRQIRDIRTIQQVVVKIPQEALQLPAPWVRMLLGLPCV